LRRRSAREDLLAAVRTVLDGECYVSPQLALTEISRDLSISPKSVSTYRSRILEKMRCRNNAEITQYAVREGLI
jgi:DNA-binding NarL/FixJ family response regulator